MQRLAAAEKSAGEAQTHMSQLQIRAEEGERRLKELTQQRQVRVGVDSAGHDACDINPYIDTSAASMLDHGCSLVLQHRGSMLHACGHHAVV